MTPEDLEAIQGILPEMVEQIQLAVNAYYGQFEDPAAVAGEAVAEEFEEPAGVAGEGVVAEEPEDLAGVAGEGVVAEEPEGLAGVAGEPEAAPEAADQSGTIENAGSPLNNQAAEVDPDGHGLDESASEEGSH
jgi:hypothetical protein